MERRDYAIISYQNKTTVEMPVLEDRTVGRSSWLAAVAARADESGASLWNFNLEVKLKGFESRQQEAD